MSNISNFQCPPPANWQDFETLCCDLWREIWDDSNTQKNGRQGQEQAGVDIFGQPRKGKKWAGIQCKGKDNFTKQKLTERELINEVEKAKTFKPELSEFIIATTCPKDAKTQKLARIITNDHQKKNLFSVTIMGWKDILEYLDDYPEVAKKHFSHLFPSTESSFTSKKDVQNMTNQILQNNQEQTKAITFELSSLKQAINNNINTNVEEKIKFKENQTRIDIADELQKNGNPIQAIKQLNDHKAEILSGSDSIEKYRFFTVLGAAQLKINEINEASNNLIEALQYNPDNYNALCNASTAMLLKNDKDKAKEYAQKAMQLNNQKAGAYSSLIQTFPDNESLENIINIIPKKNRQVSDVAYTISNLAMKRNRPEEAKKWLEIAVKNDKEDFANYKGTLGSLLLQLATGGPFLPKMIFLNKTKKKQVEKGIKLLSEAWESVANTELRKFKLIWLVNRGLGKRILGDIDGAISDIQVALTDDPTNAVFIKYSAMLAMENNNANKAISLLETIKNEKQTPEAAITLAAILRNKGKINDAIVVLEEFLVTFPRSKSEKDANRLLISLYLKSDENFSKAVRLSREMRQKNPSGIFELIDAAKIESKSGNSSSAISLLNEAKKYIQDSSTITEIVELADAFNDIQYFEDAASLYLKVVNSKENSPLTYAFLRAAYQGGIYLDKALEICQNLLKSHGNLKPISEMASVIYEEIDDLPSAKNVCKEYLREFPNDISMQIRYAALNLRTNDVKKVKSFLIKQIDLNSISLQEGLLLAQLHLTQKDDKSAINILYEMRRKFFDNPEAHLNYVGAFLHRNKENDPWLHHKHVICDSAVCISDETEATKWYIIEDRENVDMQRGELNILHPLAQEMLNKKVGDTIVIKQSELSTENAVIKEIKSKFLYAFHQTISDFQRIFPNTQGLHELKIKPPKQKGDLPLGVEPLLTQITKQHEYFEKVKNVYYTGKLTIGTFANLINVNPLDVWASIISKSDLGLKCCIGTVEERNSAIILLEKSPQLIVDVISLVTLYNLNIIELVVETFGKFGVAQSTLDLLKEIVRDHCISKNGYFSLAKEGQNFIKKEISSEDVQCQIEHFQKIINFIEKECEIIPCSLALKIRREDRNQLKQLLGVTFRDTLFIANKSNRLLLSDDLYLRGFAKNEFNIDGIWTQIILMHCRKKLLINDVTYNNMTIKLACSNYYHTSIDSYILLEAARQSEWSPKLLYTGVLNHIRGKHSSNESVISVVTNFIFLLWKEPLLLEQRQYLLLSLLNYLTMERNPENILNMLSKAIITKMRLLPLATNDIISIINSWKEIHII